MVKNVLLFVRVIHLLSIEFVYNSVLNELSKQKNEQKV